MIVTLLSVCDDEMVSLEKAIVAHYDFGGERFEILVDPDLAQAFKTGKKKEVANILAVEEVFKNARKGERHKSGDIQKAFKTQDIMAITEIILRKGEIQLTTEQKKKMLDEKKKKIIAIIAREAVDPRTGAPHTIMRLENALEQAKVSIDPFKEAESQVEGVLSAMKLILPIRFEKARIAIRVPPEHAQRVYGALKEYGIQKEEWTSNGSLVAVVEIPAGIQGEFYDKINKMTGGNIETKKL